MAFVRKLVKLGFLLIYILLYIQQTVDQNLAAIKKWMTILQEKTDGGACFYGERKFRFSAPKTRAL